MNPAVEMVYCPYLGKEIPFAKATREHIIPLALGGANGFVILADGEFNSKVGAEIDGALANDFMIAMKRQEFNAIGHSKKRPEVKSKNSTNNENGQPVQVALDRKVGMTIWDPLDRRYLTDVETSGKSFTMRFSIARWSRLRFAAKVALSAGYFLYDDLFVKGVNHEEVRTIMNELGCGDEKMSWSKSIQTRVYDQFSGPEERDKNDHQMFEFLCRFVNGSCVISVSGPRNVVFAVGVLGQMVGALNVPAVTKGFPVGEDHDLGHAVVLQKGKVFRMSCRKLLQKTCDHLEQRMKG